MLHPLQVREAVHITLLRRLTERVRDGLRLKGGVNLRLFYASVRYSEDMDLDADARHRNKLQGIIQKIIDDPGYKRELDALGVESIIPNEAQQGTGEAGLRFKMQAVAAGIAYHTKVEVSFRGSSPAEWAEVSTVPSAFIAQYRGPAFVVHRYEHPAAVVQKVNALATRAELQARDIFDLDWLLDETRFRGRRVPAMARLRIWHTQANLEKARDRCLEIDDDQYRGQVESFFDAETRERFAGGWDGMRLRVHDLLKSVAAAPPMEGGK